MTPLSKHYKAFKKFEEDPMVVVTEKDIEGGNAKGKRVLVQTHKNDKGGPHHYWVPI